MAERKGRLIDVEALWRIERIGAVSLSPDGAQAVCSVTSHSMEENKGATSLWLLSTFGGEPRRLTACGEKDGQPAWSPKGGAIAFLSKREQEGQKDDTAQLYLISPDGGEARRISDFAPGIEAFKWFADGRRIAFVSWVWPELKGTKAQAKRCKEWKERKESGYVTSEAQYRYWDRNLPMGRVAHLHVLDVASGRIVDLFEGSGLELQRMDPDANVFDIAPDGRHIAFAFDPAPQKRLDNCKALAEINSPAAARRRWRSIRPGTSRRRATARTAGGSPSSPATSAAATPRPPTPRCSSAAAPGTCSPPPGTMRSTRPCAGRPTAARSGSPPRTAPAAISGASRSRARARRSPPRAAGCTGSTSPATPSSPSPTR